MQEVKFVILKELLEKHKRKRSRDKKITHKLKDT